MSVNKYIVELLRDAASRGTTVKLEVRSKIHYANESEASLRVAEANES